MHRAIQRRPPHRTWSLTLLGTLLCLASAASTAAPHGRAGVKTFSSAPVASSPVLGLDPDECVEDYADLMEAITASGSHLHAAPAELAGGGGSGAEAAPARAMPTVWEVTPADKTLNTALARWAALAGWQLVWELPVDYAVSVRTEIRGSFTEAVGMVAKSMDTAEIPMKAIFYEGNHVLRIVAKGTE